VDVPIVLLSSPCPCLGVCVRGDKGKEGGEC
jgi:hypothetical protein